MFDRQLENINTEYDDHFRDMRRKTLIINQMNALKHKEPNEEVSSPANAIEIGSYNQSELSIVEGRQQRNHPVLTREELQKLTTGDLEEELSR